MTRVLWAFLFLVCAASTVALADDYCVEYKCKTTSWPPQDMGVYRGVEVTAYEASRSVACTCQRQVHVPTADEIANAVSNRITDAVIKGISEGTKNALKEIDEANAKREKAIYDRMIELQKQNEAELKAITALLKQLVTPPAAPPAKK